MQLPRRYCQKEAEREAETDEEKSEEVKQIGQRTQQAACALLEAIVSEAEEVLSCLCLLYTSPSPRDATLSRMPSSA